jgi:hypothetical protein
MYSMIPIIIIIIIIIINTHVSAHTCIFAQGPHSTKLGFMTRALGIQVLDPRGMT